MKLISAVVATVALSQAAQAFSLSNLFGGARIQTATSDNRAVDAACLAKAASGDCGFYSCFEQRLPCGRSGYMTRLGGYYCSRMAAQKPNFDQSGQDFIDAVQQCAITKLTPVYSQAYFDCHDFEHQAVANLSQCMTENDFCTVLRSGDNLQAFRNVLDASDLTRAGAGKVWTELATHFRSCTAAWLRESILDANAQLRREVESSHQSILQALTNSLQNTRARLTASLAETRTRLRSAFQNFMSVFRQEEEANA